MPHPDIKRKRTTLTKKEKRLVARQTAWEGMKFSGGKGDKKGKIGKSEFSKPGSFNK